MIFENPDARPAFGEIVDYAQAEVRKEVMGAESGGTEGKGSRRTSMSGGLAIHIQMAKAKKEELEEVKEDKASELDVWKS